MQYKFSAFSPQKQKEEKHSHHFITIDARDTNMYVFG
jgi:hypothetical protein